MLEWLRKRLKYFRARSDQRFNERADPKVQLEQAITEAQDQHRRLKEQAASVIANQKLTEMQLNRAMADLESLNTKARQAVVMADDANRQGNSAKAGEYSRAAESFAGQLVSTEKQVESLKTLHLQASQAADQAKAAVAQNSAVLQQRLMERQKLLSQLDQAKMQEQMNAAMATLSEAVGQDVPSFDEVRGKIEARYARALGAAELQGQTTESRMHEVEQVMADTEAQARLGQIRAELGLGAGSAGAVGTGGTSDAAALGAASGSPAGAEAAAQAPAPPAPAPAPAAEAEPPPA